MEKLTGSSSPKLVIVILLCDKCETDRTVQNVTRGDLGVLTVLASSEKVLQQCLQVFELYPKKSKRQCSSAIGIPLTSVCHVFCNQK